MSAIDQIHTVVLVMLENRSFDHMLGHLSYEGINSRVDGLKRPLSQYFNPFGGKQCSPFKMKDELAEDLPHDCDEVAQQMSFDPGLGFRMTGFVDAYAKAINKTDPGPRPAPMGFLGSEQAPIHSFLARNYCTCDRWFSPLPTSSQANRLMAFRGDTQYHKTGGRPLMGKRWIFSWLRENRIRWRVYHDGLSFFAMCPGAWDDMMFTGNFRDYEFLFLDLQSEPIVAGPEVIIVEPSYLSAPHFGSDHPNDNHPPLAVGWGEEFLRRTYHAVIANPDRWRGTVMIVYHDEHGGFWDHVPPAPIPYVTTGRTPYTFASTGPRVPAIVISPFVGPNSVSSELLDHTSVLQFLAEVFTPGRPYSKSVQARAELGVKSVSAALVDQPRKDLPPPAPPEEIKVVSALGDTFARSGDPMQASFEMAARQLLKKYPAQMAVRYPELSQWLAAKGEPAGGG